MNNIGWKRIKPLSQSNSIEIFEQEKEITVPKYLKELIRINNNGRPSLDIIKTADGSELEVKALLSYNKEDVENIYNVINYFKNQYEGKLLPFATEPSGDYFCINLTNDSIVYWEHETNELLFVSIDFREFLNRLYKI